MEKIKLLIKIISTVFVGYVIVSVFYTMFAVCDVKIYATLYNNCGEKIYIQPIFYKKDKGKIDKIVIGKVLVLNNQSAKISSSGAFIVLLGDKNLEYKFDQIKWDDNDYKSYYNSNDILFRIDENELIYILNSADKSFATNNAKQPKGFPLKPILK